MTYEWVFLLYAAVAETITAYQFFYHFCKAKDDNRLRVFWTSLVFVVTLFVISIPKEMVLNTFGSVIIFVLYAKMFFHTTLRRAAGWTTIFILIQATAEAATGLAVSFMLSTNVKTAMNNPVYAALVYLISKTLAFIFVRLITGLIPARDGKQFDKFSLLLLVFPTCAIVNELLLMTILYHSVVPRGLVLFAAFASLGLFVTTFVIVLFHDYYLQKQELERQLKLMHQKAAANEKYYRMQAKNLQEKRELLHDIKSHVQNLHASYYNKLPQAETYYDSIMCAIEKSADLVEVDVGNPLLSTILLQTEITCRENNIHFKYAPQYFDLEFLAPLDTSTIFDNAIENAITACMCDDVTQVKRIEIAIYKTAHYIVFEFVNTCMPTLLKFENGRLVSTKQQGNPEEHGIGIKNIISASEKYGGYANYTCENNTFCLFVRVQNPAEASI